MSKVVIGLLDRKIDHGEICKGCVKGKNIKNPFSKSDTKSEGILELIHLYVCGIIPSTSLSGYVYYVTFIYYYSRNKWVYFLKSRDGLFGNFKEFNTLVENLSERNIKTLGRDNGAEYTSN